MVYGVVGSNEIGVQKNFWVFVVEGSDFDFILLSFKFFEVYCDVFMIVSNIDVCNVEVFIVCEVGGDYFWLSVIFLIQVWFKQMEGLDVEVGILFDQMYVQCFGQDILILLMQFCIENVDQLGGCVYGYVCVYIDMIFWVVKDCFLLMVCDLCVVFDQFFGVGGIVEECLVCCQMDCSIFDWIIGEVGCLSVDFGSMDCYCFDQYFEYVCEVECCIYCIEEYNVSGEVCEFFEVLIGVFDSFEEYV